VIETRNAYKEIYFENLKQKSQDSRTWERTVYTNSNTDRGGGQHHNEQKGGNYFNRFDHRDRGGNDKNRSGRIISRRNSSNTLTLPDTFNNLPPRLQKQYLQKEGLSSEEIEKYLDELKIMPSNNRDNRYSQALPTKNNRNLHFKMNKNKEPPMRGSRVFHQKPRYNESSDSGPPMNVKTPGPFNAESKPLSNSAENWEPEPVCEYEETPLDNTHEDKHSAESSSDEGGALEDTNEVIVSELSIRCVICFNI
jgi:hypothetical protein